MVRTTYNPQIQFAFVQLQMQCSKVLPDADGAICRGLAERAWKYGRQRGHDGRTLFIAQELLAALELPELAGAELIRSLANELLAPQETRPEGITGFFYEKDRADAYRSITYAGHPAWALLRLAELAPSGLEAEAARCREAVALYCNGYLAADAASNPFDFTPYGVFKNPEQAERQTFRDAGGGLGIRSFIHPFSWQGIAHGTSSVATAHAAILSKAAALFGVPTWRALAEQLTVNETLFFRNADNFLALADIVLPERIRAKAQTKQLRILSAGCSSGDEPYSLAIMVREALPDLEDWDVKIIGMDINPAVLIKATQARYSEWSLRATSDDVRSSYFQAEGADFVLSPEIQRMVSFEERNLVDEDPLFWESLACDLVFCRNVLMYFTPETARGVVRRISQALLPSGYLFIGHAETLRGITPEFHLCHTHDTFYYQQRDTSGSAVTATWVARPSWEPSEDLLPDVIESKANWAEVIELAATRIATLADARTRSPELTAPQITRTHTESRPAVTAQRRTWDLSLVLEAVRQERFADAFRETGSRARRKRTRINARRRGRAAS
jgi:chemotaxis methyl-accepting protein methylase